MPQKCVGGCLLGELTALDFRGPLHGGEGKEGRERVGDGKG